MIQHAQTFGGIRGFAPVCKLLQVVCKPGILLSLRAHQILELFGERERSAVAAGATFCRRRGGNDTELRLLWKLLRRNKFAVGGKNDVILDFLFGKSNRNEVTALFTAHYIIYFT